MKGIGLDSSYSTGFSGPFTMKKSILKEGTKINFTKR